MIDSQQRVDLHRRLDIIRRGGDTVRYHGVPVHINQRIDSHSGQVAALTTVIVPKATWERRATLLMAALAHDLAEFKFGDIPAPAKRELGIREVVGAAEEEFLGKYGFSHELGEADKRVLKIADAAEGCLHCVHERMMGNQYIGERCFYNFWGYLRDELQMGGIFGGEGKRFIGVELGEVAVSSYIHNAWTKANGGKW